MSMMSSGSGTAQGTAGSTDIVTQLQNIARLFSALIKQLGGQNIYGSFTLAAAATTTVAQTGVKANSIIQLTPTDASAGTLQGSAKALYVSSISAGTSFTVATASGGNAVGTETFSYVVVTP